MAQSISHYNHTRRLWADGDVDIANLKVMLRDGSTVFDPTHATVSDLAGSEVSGNGWDAGGESIDNASVTTTETNEATLDGDDVSVEATGGSIGPAESAVIIDDSVSPARLLYFIDFDGEEEAGEGTNFNVQWHADGIARWRAPS